ncbi:MAG: hypothetical protein AB7H80_15835 [Candidatus Kapaibacterium sp.]
MEIQNQLVNPDSTYTAAYYTVDAGATTTTGNSIAIIRTSEKIEVGEGRGTVIFASDEGRPHMQWLTSDTLQKERYTHHFDLSREHSEDGAVQIVDVEPEED